MFAASRRRRFLLVGLLLLAAIVAAAVCGYRGWKHVPDHYRRALAADAAGQRQAAYAIRRKVTALASQRHRDGNWRTEFTAEQINAWLAVDLVEKHPELLPDTVREPRVAIGQDEIVIAWSYGDGPLACVYSLTFVPFVPEPDLLAVRLSSVRAGAIPVPLGSVLDAVTEAALLAELRLSWRTAGGEPVAVIDLPTEHDSRGRRPVLEQIELADGKIVLSGTTASRPDVPRQARKSATRKDRDQAGEKVKR